MENKKKIEEVHFRINKVSNFVFEEEIDIDVDFNDHVDVKNGIVLNFIEEENINRDDLKDVEVSVVIVKIKDKILFKENFILNLKKI